jgi:hypothetical protein
LWSLHDSVELEKRGVATATIVTSGFTNAAQAHRGLLKRPELPFFIVPHPIVSMLDNELQASADAIFDGIVQAISESVPNEGAAQELIVASQATVLLFPR